MGGREENVHTRGKKTKQKKTLHTIQYLFEEKKTKKHLSP